eukprot:CAMPEP_0172678870 /NCGR_PEP_ID=MMETSP1074-20121228/15681_1 /TAXON_ID=2916 /ORGANISM="Ceratium fusus, Strain PA161109" /LENGTH=428 /DNA_ID=CAMNT_0013496965 /DNA_START=55 /DNA_END=1338 /DNA_ORIENTATION=-
MPGETFFSSQHDHSGLRHMSFHCPGLHGPNAAKQEIGRHSFGELLGRGCAQLRVPPFQRAYCWDEQLAAGWWRDLRKGSHSTGKSIFCPLVGADPSKMLLVIDGQQRLTTTCLLLMAIRDAAQRAAAIDVVLECERSLFIDVAAFQEWLEAVRQALMPGIDTALKNACDFEKAAPHDGPISLASLVPSLRDRPAFARMLCGPHLGLQPSASADCAMVRVKTYFDAACHGRNSRQLSADLRCALDGMQLMVVRIVEPPLGLAQQVYQWAQERALGVSLEVHNPTPGRWLAVSDLARNLLLAPFLDVSMEEMESVLREHWLPLEEQFDGTHDFDHFLKRFVTALPRASPSAAAVPILETAAGIEALMPSSSLAAPLRLYAEFLAELDAQAAALQAQDTGMDAKKIVLVASVMKRLRRFALDGVKEPLEVP